MEPKNISAKQLSKVQIANHQLQERIQSKTPKG
jgi:hypothetical protein